MEISSSTPPSTATAPKEESDPTKKALEAQEQQMTKIVDKMDEQARQMNAQKTGVGNSINLTA